MRTFSAVIFDMDGVIVDSEPLHEKAFAALFEELGHGRDTGVDYADYFGCSDLSVVEDLIKRNNLPHQPADLLARKHQLFLSYIREHCPVFTELYRLLPELQAHYALAIASSSPHAVIDAVMEITGLRRYFKTIVGVEDVRVAKPDPEIYLVAAKRLGVQPSDCCAIEDAATGIRAAKAAGMTVIGITTTLPPEKLKEADFVVGDFGSICKILLPSNRAKTD